MARLGETFPHCENISIDYAVLERAKNVVGVPTAEFGWNDVGSWAAVYEQSPKDASGNACRGDLLTVEASGCLVEAQDKLVALVGVKDLVVVDAGDALLICHRDRSQQVREVVERLKKDRGGQCL
jgi:mannose-1-phosphate guanylyltransferase